MSVVTCNTRSPVPVGLQHWSAQQCDASCFPQPRLPISVLTWQAGAAEVVEQVSTVCASTDNRCHSLKDGTPGPAEKHTFHMHASLQSLHVA
jgi:hypothetical protein